MKVPPPSRERFTLTPSTPGERFAAREELPEHVASQELIIYLFCLSWASQTHEAITLQVGLRSRS